MNKDISVCGSDCGKCYCFESKMCKGCNSCKGIVFHTDGKECAIYHCCSNHGYRSCVECATLPCDIWKKTRDPKFTDEEFEKNISDRIKLLEQQLISNK